MSTSSWFHRHPPSHGHHPHHHQDYWRQQVSVSFRYVTVGTTAAESMNAAANIFLGQTEVLLLTSHIIDQLLMSWYRINVVLENGRDS